MRSTGASCAAEAVGVRGDTGGRSGVGDFERCPECAEPVETSLEETRRVLVSTRSAGMAAWWETTPGAGPESSGRRQIGDRSDVKVRSDHVGA